MRLSSRFFPLVLLNLLALEPAAAYSVLTHEAIIDSSWPNQIKPLLLKRFPTVTEEQLREAHGFAYGGAIIQDMGYYPFGSKFLSDLLHYVRSGEFIAALLRESQDINEYAFALGALAHYASDNEGHPIAVNRVVPMLYPKLRAKYGPEVTYEDDPAAHLKTEFAFDVVEVAGGKYASEAYHDFIGFQVSKALLERAFKDTYSLELNRVLPDEDLALGTYRYTVSKLIPEMTKTAWSAKKKEILQLEAGMTRRRFVYRLSRASYHRDWDKRYEQPGPGARFLAWLLQILPKVGPLKALAFKVPTPDAEKLFLTSVADTRRRYLELIDGVNENALRLQNENFDIGRPTRRGEYRKADESYAKLLEEFADSPDQVSDDLRADILRFYGPSGAPSSDKAGTVLSALRGHAAPADIDK
ncbi:MAG TPA: zinc dependent phospholipase C family protein [Bryobacteraceae bacterium]|nr:zinc dependent phospholipase C family protein [Bryobacteraceae bacterium]